MIRKVMEQFTGSRRIRFGRRGYVPAAFAGVLFGLAWAAQAVSLVWVSSAPLSAPVSSPHFTASPVVAVTATGAGAAVWIAENKNLLLQVAAQDASGDWSAAQTMTPASGVNAANPTVAVSEGGTAVAMWDAWQAGSRAGWVIQASWRQPYGSWSPATSLTSPTTGSSRRPQVGMDAGGNATAIWLRSTPTTSVIEAANFSAGGSWGAPVALSTPGVAVAAPTLAVNMSGDALAAWQTAKGQILIAERRLGVWGAPIIIAPPAFRQGSPRVALNDRGDGAVTWSGPDTTWAATRYAGGSWGAPVSLSTQSAGATARIAIDNLGNTVAVFGLVQSSAVGVTYPVMAASRPFGGSWSVSGPISGAAEQAGGLSLAASPAGMFVAGWVDSATGAVTTAVRPAGQYAFEPATVIGSGTQPAFAAAEGRAVAAWVGLDRTIHSSEANIQ